jgi:hypothetical protein
MKPLTSNSTPPGRARGAREHPPRATTAAAAAAAAAMGKADSKGSGAERRAGAKELREEQEEDKREKKREKKTLWNVCGLSVNPLHLFFLVLFTLPTMFAVADWFFPSISKPPGGSASHSSPCRRNALVKPPRGGVAWPGRRMRRA